MNKIYGNEFIYLQNLPTATLKELSNTITNLVMFYNGLPESPPKFIFDVLIHQREIINLLEKRMSEKLAEGY